MNTRETVDWETPANLATSLDVTTFFLTAIDYFKQFLQYPPRMTSSNQGVLVEFQRSEILTQVCGELIMFLFQAVGCTDLILVDR